MIAELLHDRKRIFEYRYIPKNLVVQFDESQPEPNRYKSEFATCEIMDPKSAVESGMQDVVAVFTHVAKSGCLYKSTGQA